MRLRRVGDITGGCIDFSSASCAVLFVGTQEPPHELDGLPPPPRRDREPRVVQLDQYYPPHDELLESMVPRFAAEHVLQAASGRDVAQELGDFYDEGHELPKSWHPWLRVWDAWSTQLLSCPFITSVRRIHAV